MKDHGFYYSKYDIVRRNEQRQLGRNIYLGHMFVILPLGNGRYRLHSLPFYCLYDLLKYSRIYYVWARTIVK